MAQKLYVGGLPYQTTEDELRDAFAQAGSVTSSMIITDRMSGRSKGFGFIEMATDKEALAAIDMWNGKEFNGRRLTVNEARPREERAPRQYSDNGGSNNQSNW
ncbi:MAG: RNA-binding protein [Candidatus Moraniibacteriota bacterium]